MNPAETPCAVVAYTSYIPGATPSNAYCPAQAPPSRARRCRRTASPSLLPKGRMRFSRQHEKASRIAAVCPHKQSPHTRSRHDAGLVGFAQFWAEGRQDLKPVVENACRGSDPILARLQTVNAIHAAIVGLSFP